MRSATLLKRADVLRQEVEKGQLLKELSALLLTTTLKTKRAYIQKAIDYIEKH